MKPWIVVQTQMQHLIMSQQTLAQAFQQIHQLKTILAIPRI